MGWKLMGKPNQFRAQVRLQAATLSRAECSWPEGGIRFKRSWLQPDASEEEAAGRLIYPVGIADGLSRARHLSQPLHPLPAAGRQIVRLFQRIAPQAAPQKADRRSLRQPHRAVIVYRSVSKHTSRGYLSIMSRPMGGRTALPGMETLSMVTQPQPPLSELISSRV